MTTNTLFRALTAFALLAVTTSAVVTPALAQGKQSASKSTKQAAATLYECKECKLKFTAAEAKKKGFKCDCGCKLVVVKSAKKAAGIKKG